MRKKAFKSFLVLVVLGGIVACPTSPPNYPTKPIELKYYAAGPWPVTVSTGGACCDSAHNKFDLYYPTNLGANGFVHPILTWGNGSFALPLQYDYFLRHIASWGFAVIATEDQQTGVGQTILDGANFLVHANSDPASIFFHKLNVNQIGAFGHSQGAGGAGNALIKSSGLIKPLSQLSFRRESGVRSAPTASNLPTLLQDQCSSLTDQQIFRYPRQPRRRRRLENNRFRPSTMQRLVVCVRSRELSSGPITMMCRASRIVPMPRFPVSMGSMDI